MTFRRAAVITLAWVLVGFGIDFDGKTPTLASQGNRSIRPAISPPTPATAHVPVEEQ